MSLMTVGLMDSPGQISLVKRQIPDIGPADALVRIAFVGVCGSDMALFENGYIGESVVDGPMVLGHEASGTVVAVGANVTHLKVGDRVALEPGVPCGVCEQCRRGTYNLCPSVYFWASLPVKDGAFQEYVRHPASFCYPLPDNVGLLEGALVEPLSVAFHAVQRSGVQVGASAAVLGAGAIGLLTLLTLRAAGAVDLCVVDVMENRLETARALGGQGFNATSEDFSARLAARYPSGPDYVYEAAGNQVTMNQAITLAKRGGTVTLIGYTKSGRADLNVNGVIDKELTISSAFRYRNVYPQVISAISDGIIPVRGVVSNIYPLDDILDGMNHAVHHKSEVTKCVIQFDPNASA